MLYTLCSTAAVQLGTDRLITRWYVPFPPTLHITVESEIRILQYLLYSRCSQVCTPYLETEALALRIWN